MRFPDDRGSACMLEYARFPDDRGSACVPEYARFPDDLDIVRGAAFEP
jgi:hypothetical protein